MKFGCSFAILLNSANLIYRSTDISRCFRESLGLRDNENHLHITLKVEGYNFMGSKLAVISLSNAPSLQPVLII